MYKFILILDKFFFKYEGEGGDQFYPHPQKKLPSKSPFLSRLKFRELLESQKSNFLVFLVLKVLTKIKIGISSVNGSKSSASPGSGHIYLTKSLKENFIFCVVSPKLVGQSRFKKLQENSKISLIFTKYLALLPWNLFCWF